MAYILTDKIRTFSSGDPPLTPLDDSRSQKTFSKLWTPLANSHHKTPTPLAADTSYNKREIPVCLPVFAQGSSWVTAVTSSVAAAPNRNGLLAAEAAVKSVSARSSAGCEVGSKRSKFVVGSSDVCSMSAKGLFDAIVAD